MDSDHSYFKYVILGSGMAGLSAANALVDQNEKPLLIDQTTPGGHKICGEFFSHQCLPLLKSWGLLPSNAITTVHLHLGGIPFSFTPKNQARSEGHPAFDQKLFQRAQDKGLLFQKAKVQSITHKDNLHIITLENGQIIEAEHLFVGFGRPKNQKPKYIGFKTHFTNVSMNKALDLYPVKKGYIGLSQVGKDLVNVAGLVSINEFSSIENTLKQNPALMKRLDKAKNVFETWKMAKVGSFGLKESQNIKNRYSIGDGFCTVYPASGLGLSLSLLSGYEAAQHALNNEWSSYYKIHRKRAKKVLRYSRFLHFFLQKPKLCSLGLKWFPALAPLSYEWRPSLTGKTKAPIT